MNTEKTALQLPLNSLDVANDSFHTGTELH